MMSRWPPWTVRARLTVLYMVLFLASGIALLAIAYSLLSRQQGNAYWMSAAQAREIQSVGQTQGAVAAKRLLERIAATSRTGLLHSLLLDSAVALGVMTMISAWLGWLMAGRVLRPVRLMTTKAQRISEQNLHERLAIDGPHDELKRLADTFDGLLARLEGAFDAQRQFIANASHELRTPLTLQRAMVEVALADPGATAESLRRTCERVVVAGEQHERLIDGLLMLARGQRGLDRHEPLDLGLLVRQTLPPLRVRAAAAGLDLDTGIGRAPVAGDGLLLARLVVNLVDNGLRYNEPDGWVRVTTRISAGRVVLRVVNTGPRVPAGEIDRILLPFQRLGTARAAQPAGFGLGMAIARTIAAAHGASFTVRPRLEGGLDVAVAFPVRGEAPEAPEASGVSSGRAGQAAHRQLGQQRGAVGEHVIVEHRVG
jgi:signal transduction histidine kinase